MIIHFSKNMQKKTILLLLIFFFRCLKFQYIDEMRKKVSSSYEINWNLNVCIPQNNHLTLYDCLDFTFKEEYLCDDNAWLDDKTNEKNKYINV